MLTQTLKRCFGALGAVRIPFGPLRGMLLKWDPSLSLRETLGLTDRKDMRYLNAALKLLLENRKRDLVMVDAGSNMGLYSLYCAKAFGRNIKKIFAFEPNPSTYSILCENLKLNQMDKVEAVPIALSESRGTVRFEITANNHTAHLSTAYQSPNSQGNQIEVCTDTLDGFFSEASKRDLPDFIKMDIEGAAKHALLPVAHIIEKNRPWFFVESHSLEEDATIGYLAVRYGYGAFDINREIWVADLTKTFPDPHGVSGKLILVPNEIGRPDFVRSK